MDYRTDLAVESTEPQGSISGVAVQTQRAGEAEITWVRVETEEAARQLGKPMGTYWTLTHPELPHLDVEGRMQAAKQVAQVLRLMLPPEGDILVLGLGNRRMTADALGDRVVSGILVTRHIKEGRLRGVCAMAPGVLGVTGVETAEMARGLVERLRPAAVLVVDALAAREMDHIASTVQLTDTGIHPGSGVGNHRMGITRETMQVPVIALGIPMVVYASTIVRDTLRGVLQGAGEEEAEAMAAWFSGHAEQDLVVTPRNIDELVAGLADMLALSINSALQTAYSIDELSRYLH